MHLSCRERRGTENKTVTRSQHALIFSEEAFGFAYDEATPSISCRGKLSSVSEKRKPLSSSSSSSSIFCSLPGRGMISPFAFNERICFKPKPECAIVEGLTSVIYL